MTLPGKDCHTDPPNSYLSLLDETVIRSSATRGVGNSVNTCICIYPIEKGVVGNISSFIVYFYLGKFPPLQPFRWAPYKNPICLKFSSQYRVRKQPTKDLSSYYFMQGGGRDYHGPGLLGNIKKQKTRPVDCMHKTFLCQQRVKHSLCG